MMDRVKDGATAQLSNQKNKATDGLGTLAAAVRKTCQPLRESDQTTLASYVEQAADGIERFSSDLRQRDIGELVNEAQRFARRKPALFIGGAFAVGVLAARFLKSSAEAGTLEPSRDWRRMEGQRASGLDRTRPLAPGYGGL
jgi:hypothetical protein